MPPQRLEGAIPAGEVAGPDVHCVCVNWLRHECCAGAVPAKGRTAWCGEGFTWRGLVLRAGGGGRVDRDKGVRWMPWRQEAKKDVARCEKPRGDASDR